MGNPGAQGGLEVYPEGVGVVSERAGPGAGAKMGSGQSPEAQKPRGHLGAKALLEGSVGALGTWKGHPRGHGTCPG